MFTEGEAEAAVKTELGEETGLVEEDLVAVSYMSELDLETVGDIIAIIEEKVHTCVFVKATKFTSLTRNRVDCLLNLCSFKKVCSEGYSKHLVSSNVED